MAGGPSWQVVLRGRDRNVDTHIYGHTSSAHIVYALLMHTQNRSEGNESGEIPITCITTCTLHGINRHNQLTIVFKCNDNFLRVRIPGSACNTP